MSFRARLLLACVPLALVPLVLFGLDARREVIDRLDAQYAESVTALADVIAEDLARESEAIASRLDRVAVAIGSDPRLRPALLDPDGAEPTARAYLLDYAPDVMRVAGLDVLRIQAADGRVLSSGHFRNEYDLRAGSLPIALERASDGPVLAEVSTPGGSIFALARRRTLQVGAETLTVVGGTKVDAEFLARLARGTQLDVGLRTPEGEAGALDSGAAPVGHESEVILPYAGDVEGEGVARFLVRSSDVPLVVLRRDMDRRLLAASAAAATLALLLAALVSAQLARPVATLAERAGRMDLDRMDVAFSTERADEIGDLSRVLDRVARRLRASAVRLRDAERRATTGDIARQVHHDVRNGLIPIRNVLAHLAEVAKEKPEAMPGIFLERQGTLDSSVAHLHALAASYARLSPAVEREPCDVNAIVRRVAEDVEAAVTVRIDVDLAAHLPRVEADPVALRRILDNLTVNAVESLDGLAPGGPEGRVCIGTRSVSSNGAPRVEVTVTDTGRGMTPDERVRIFDDFYTTRPGGTGLGLSIVRRLITDMDGGIEVESAPGNGTKVIVDLPARPLSLGEPLQGGTTPPEAAGGEAKGRAATEGAGGLT